MDQVSLQHFQNGNRLFERGDYQRSKKEYQEVLKHYPQAGAVHHNLAMACYNLGQGSCAEKEYQEAIRCGYENAAIYYRITELLLATKCFEKSLAFSLKGIAIDLEEPAAPIYNNLGSAYLKIGEAANKAGETTTAQENFVNAVAASKKALSLDPGNALSHLIFGHVHLVQKRYVAAIAEYDVALHRDSDLIPAHNARAVALFHQRRFSEGFREMVLLVRTIKKQIAALIKTGSYGRS